MFSVHVLLAAAAPPGASAGADAFAAAALRCLIAAGLSSASTFARPSALQPVPFNPSVVRFVLAANAVAKASAPTSVTPLQWSSTSVVRLVGLAANAVAKACTPSSPTLQYPKSNLVKPELGLSCKPKSVRCQ